MSSCKVHESHDHVHGANCGHAAIAHDGHIDYLHDNHLHHVHGNHIDEHVLPISQNNAAACTPNHTCDMHDDEHEHSDNCGHAAVPHGDHLDYLVDGHLHRPHGSHCDHHGQVTIS